MVTGVGVTGCGFGVFDWLLVLNRHLGFRFGFQGSGYFVGGPHRGHLNFLLHARNRRRNSNKLLFHTQPPKPVTKASQLHELYTHPLRTKGEA